VRREVGESVSLFLVTWSALLEPGRGHTPERLLDDVMEHMLADDRALDPSISYERRSQTAAIELTVEASDPLDCVETAAAVIRRATRAAHLVTTLLPLADESATVSPLAPPEPALRFGRGPELVAV
jgi:hypothetical protein